MNLAELQKEAHAIAKEKGSWDEECTFSHGDLIAVVHSELSEALEAYRERGLESWSSRAELAILGEERKPEGVAFELADVVIRVADMAEWYGVDLSNLPVSRHYWEEHSPISRHYWEDHSPITLNADWSFGDWICIIHRLVALVSWRASGLRKLAQVVRAVQQMAAHYGIDLDAAIEAKMEYNRGRSYRHGGKSL